MEARTSNAKRVVRQHVGRVTGSRGVLLVGGGQAAMWLAVSLRELGWQEAVTIAGDEPYAPYQRPPLSKAFLSGGAKATTLEFRSAERYERDPVHAVNSPRDYLAVRRALAAGQEIPAELAADPGTPLQPAGAGR